MIGPNSHILIYLMDFIAGVQVSSFLIGFGLGIVFAVVVMVCTAK